MKVLVLGASGQLGSEIKFLADGFPFQFEFCGSKGLDVSKEDQVRLKLSDGQYDYVVNCSAYTAVDKAETEIEKAEAVNVNGAKHLAKECKSANSILIHVSTDFVFDGDKNTPYEEEDFTNPLGIYGQTKLDGEKEIQKHLGKHFIIRTSWLYSSFGNNFVKTMLRLSENNEEIGVICDQIGTPTYARDLAELILKIIQDSNSNFGIYHFSNHGVASWYDFAKAIFELKSIELIVNPIGTVDYPTPAERPKYSVLSKSKLEKNIRYKVPYWRESLSRMLKVL
jgi:dTDP-4-dehydrorhamnose reductase